MPFSFRKSKTMGPVRMTVSKSGITTSVGVKGARVGIGPHGTYVRVGRGGISYRQALNRKPAPARPRASISDASVDDVDVEELIDASSEDVLNQLNNPPGSWFAKIFGRVKPATLTYDLDDTGVRRFAIVEQAIGALAEARQLWRVDSQVATADRKRHGGATAAVTRHPIRAGLLPAPGIETNITVHGIDAGSQQFFFFPDRIFVRRGKRYGAVPYEGLQVRYAPLRFNDEGRVSADAQIVGHTWRYVNKNGGPDKRFNDNR